jgi:HAE1 family hydrophobic/amphiphilic exporter-1
LSIVIPKGFFPQQDTAPILGQPDAIDDTLGDAFGQRIVSTIFTTLQQYHVILEVNPRFQHRPEALAGIYVKSAAGQQVPISTLVDSVITVAPLARA